MLAHVAPAIMVGWLRDGVCDIRVRSASGLLGDVASYRPLYADCGCVFTEKCRSTSQTCHPAGPPLPWALRSPALCQYRVELEAAIPIPRRASRTSTRSRRQRRPYNSMPLTRPNNSLLSVEIAGPPAEAGPKSSGPIRSSDRRQPRSAKRPSPYKKPKSAAKSPSEVLGAALGGIKLVSARRAPALPSVNAAAAEALLDEQPVSARTRARLNHSFGKSGLAFVESKLRNARLAQKRTALPAPAGAPAARPRSDKRKAEVPSRPRTAPTDSGPTTAGQLLAAARPSTAGTRRATGNLVPPAAAGSSDMLADDDGPPLIDYQPRLRGAYPLAASALAASAMGGLPESKGTRALRGSMAAAAEPPRQSERARPPRRPPPAPPSQHEEEDMMEDGHAAKRRGTSVSMASQEARRAFRSHGGSTAAAAASEAAASGAASSRAAADTAWHGGMVAPPPPRPAAPLLTKPVPPPQPPAATRFTRNSQTAAAAAGGGSSRAPPRAVGASQAARGGSSHVVGTRSAWTLHDDDDDDAPSRLLGRSRANAADSKLPSGFSLVRVLGGGGTSSPQVLAKGKGLGSVRIRSAAHAECTRDELHAIRTELHALRHMHARGGHMHLVSLLDAIETPEHTHLILEPTPGGTLRERISAIQSGLDAPSPSGGKGP